MSVNAKIEAALKSLNVPVSSLTSNNHAASYIVYTEYNQAPWLSADDEEWQTKHFYQVDVFSSGNYIQLVEDVKELMKQAGFKRMFESETYDDEAKKNRKIIRFHYISRQGEE
ncbi:hypothetical protein HXA35_15510 [Bacillus sp. A301a_S52]|jgi:hypothetical protein|nr:hypothetical protein [Bacillus sp. A301a_S52]UJW58741.1 hypothetical protein HXZ66_15590 [Bacillus sp. A116_S68]